MKKRTMQRGLARHTDKAHTGHQTGVGAPQNDKPLPPLVAALRLRERDDCARYWKCLNDVSKDPTGRSQGKTTLRSPYARFVPCVGCPAFLQGPAEVCLLHSNWPSDHQFPPCYAEAS